MKSDMVDKLTTRTDMLFILNLTLHLESSHNDIY